MFGWYNPDAYTPMISLPCPRCKRKRPEINTALAVCRCWWCGLVFTIQELETGSLGVIKNREAMATLAFPKDPKSDI